MVAGQLQKTSDHYGRSNDEPDGSDNVSLFEYKDRLYPEYIKHGNACQFITPFALQFCKGRGLDIGAGKWPLPGAIPVDQDDDVYHAMNLPPVGAVNYIFSSHCLEHLANPVAVLEYWLDNLLPGGVLFLYLPHPHMEYWLPQNNRKHLHTWMPRVMAKMVSDLGFINVIHSERDLAWSFAVVGVKP